ncbi:hypothetical protein H6H01_29985 [Nostoc calcicola FACHB-3891]|nr:hypothetical protein [Nostoc calcicola FACHB-3891]MDZ8062599.1 hypothetical protein [Nostoc sp. EkiNYC01]
MQKSLIKRSLTHKLLRSPQVPDSLLNIEYTYFGIASYLKNHYQFSVHKHPTFFTCFWEP